MVIHLPIKHSLRQPLLQLIDQTAALKYRRPLAQAHGGERRLDHVGGTQMLPMLGGKVEESNQPLPVGRQRLDRLGVLGLILRLETRAGGLAIGAALGVHHLVERALGARL